MINMDQIEKVPSTQEQGRNKRRKRNKNKEANNRRREDRHEGKE